MYTYAIWDGCAIKIGRSSNVTARKDQLQTASSSVLIVLDVINGDHEREIHTWLDDNGHTRARGEWFIDGDLLRVALCKFGFRISPIPALPHRAATMQDVEDAREAGEMSGWSAAADFYQPLKTAPEEHW